jgi:hypothetical protein
MAIALLTSLALTSAIGCGNATSDPAPEPSTDSPTAGAATVGQEVHASPACETIEQTVVINSDSDLQQFAGNDCFKIEGHLFIQNTTDIDNLDELAGLVSVSRFIGIADNTALTDISLPMLNHVGLGFVIEGNDVLQSVTADTLGFVGYDLHIFNNAQLASVSFECLTQVVSDVIFAGVDALTNLELPYLTKVGGVFIFEHSDGLDSLCLPRLATVGSDFIVHYNGGLQVISVPLLDSVGGDFKIVRNPSLSGLHHSSLSSVDGDVIIQNNASLSTCNIQANAQLVDVVGGSVTISANSNQCTPMTQPPADCADVCMGQRDDDGDDGDDKATYLAILNPLQTNTFGRVPSGAAIFTVSGDSFTARVEASGLDDAIHPQHIHGFIPVQEGVCPTAADDANGDGFVDVLEGAPDYGPIQVPLDGDLADTSMDPATFPTGSSYQYMESDSVSAIKAALGVSDLALEAKHVVVHGVSGDRSLPDSVQSIAGLPANVTLPVACGQIIRIN